MNVINEGLVKLLGFVTSVKALTNIRDELWNILKQASLSLSLISLFLFDLKFCQFFCLNSLQVICIFCCYFEACII